MEDHNSMDIKIEENFDVDCSRTQYYGLIPVFVLIVLIFVRVTFVLCKSYGQKTRTPAQRRMYVGSRARQSLSQTEPTIYVSPANLPPPPKYECLAPPSYEEVVGIHYPQYQSQPITQPIATAMAAQSSSANTSATEAPTTVIEAPTTVVGAPTTVLTVTSETRVTATQVAAS